MIYLCGILLAAILTVLTVYDLRAFRLPDFLTLPLIALGIGQATLLQAGTIDALIGAAAGYLFFVSIEFAYRRLRGRDGLGRGDAKLLAAGGAWCGWAGLPLIVLISSALALVAILILPGFKDKAEDKNEGGAVPFGPFLALAIFLVWTAIHLAQ